MSAASAGTKRSSAVRRIKDDLRNLSATEFEMVAHALLREIEGIPLAHRGLTEKGNPSGYTVDTLSLGGDVVGEYGTQKDYFRTPFEKLSNDVLHALDLCPNLERLYLMSNQECGNTALLEAHEVVVRVAPRLNAKSIRVFSCQELADEMYRRFVPSGGDAAYFLADHLDEFARLLDEEVYDLATPRVGERHVRDGELFDRLSAALTSNPVVQVVGVSGTGKTQMCSDWVRENRADFDSVVWIGGSDLPSSYNLRGVRVERLGVRLNLASHLGRAKTLMVVDDFRGEMDKLESEWRDMAGPAGRLLVTAQTAGGLGAVLQVNGVSERTARVILPERLSEGEFDLVYTACAGLPLAMALFRNLVERGLVTSPSALAEVLGDIHLTRDGTGLSLAQRLLDRHLSVVGRALALLHWIGSQRLENQFLREVVGLVEYENLKACSLLVPDGPTILKLHDLVWTSLKSLDLPTVEASAREKLEVYVRKHAMSGPRHYRVMLELLAERIRSCRSESTEHGLWTFAYLQLDSLKLSPDDLGSLAQSPAPQGEDWCTLASWVEAKERFGRNESVPGDFDLASARILQATAILVISPQTRALLQHHAGKFYAKSKQFDEAEKCFREALQVDGEYPQVRLALARLVRKRGRLEEGQKLIEELVLQRDAIGVSAALSAYTELVSYPELLQKYVIDSLGEFLTFVGMARVDGFAQPEDTVRAVCRGLEYTSPETVVELAGEIEVPGVDEMRSPQEMNRWAEFYLLEASCLKKTKREFLAVGEQSRRLYEAAGKLSDFDKSRYAKCLLLLELPVEALAVVEGSDDVFCRFYHTQSLAQLGRFEEAEWAIDALLADTQEQPSRFTWDFHRWQGLIRRKKGNRQGARESLEAALARCPSSSALERVDILAVLNSLA